VCIYRRSVEPKQPEPIFVTGTLPAAVPLVTMPTYDEIPDAVGGYEQLRAKPKELPPPPPRAADKPPPPPVKPRPKSKSTQPDGNDDYLHISHFMQ